MPLAKVYDIPWVSKSEISIEQCRYLAGPVEMPKITNTHLWLLNLSEFDHKPYLQSLSDDESEKLNRFISSKERESRAKSRILLRIVLAEYLNTLPSKIVFSYGENGKPSLKAPFNKLSFNISHSANNLAILIDSHRCIGVDIESESRPSNVGLQLAKRFFCQQEINLLQEAKSKEQSILFNCIWTLKEAVLKSSGSGVFLIDEAPDFSFIIKKNSDSNLQFYKTKKHIGFTFYTQDFWLSTAAEN